MSLAAVSVAYLIARFRMFGGLGFLPPPYGVDLSSLSGIVELLMHLAQYLLDFVLFIQIDMVYMDEFWASHPWLLLLIAALAIAIAAAAWRVAGKTRAFRVGLIWTILFTLPTLPAMPGERNVYLASVGVALMGAGVLSALIQRMKTRVTVGWWLPPAAVAVASVCVALLAFEQVIVWRAAGASDQVYDDLLAALPDPPPGARIYVVNQSPLNSIGFTQAVRLMYDRDDILACALTVAPQLEGISSDLVDRTGPASVRIVRQNGRFFQGFFERLLLLGNPAADLPESAKRMELRLLTRLESLDAVIELELGLPRNLDDEGIYLFTWDNRHVITTADLIWRAPWPNLVKCRFAQPPDALASN